MSWQRRRLPRGSSDLARMCPACTTGVLLPSEASSSPLPPAHPFMGARVAAPQSRGGGFSYMLPGWSSSHWGWGAAVASSVAAPTERGPEKWTPRIQPLLLLCSVSQVHPINASNPAALFRCPSDSVGSISLQLRRGLEVFSSAKNMIWLCCLF